ncbi:4'-phosphopantetheinyl transferase [Backusella circina FSU 941]|nr:4'-phosphopantetheinyl transferase [Backusella circina FSU 941]
MTKLDLLSFNITGVFEGDKFNEALSFLPVEEHKAVLRFKFDRDKHLALANLLLRRHYFSKLLKKKWFDLEFGKYPGGKPYIKCDVKERMDYNTSHEGNWVIFGCIKDPLMAIGVDAVIIDRPKNESIDAFVKSFQPQLTHSEMQMIMASEDPSNRLQTFYELWGCKESYTKALGVGLSLELQKLCFMNENEEIKMTYEGKKSDTWCYHLSYLDDVNIAVVCYGCDSLNHIIDPETYAFSKTSRLLGAPLHNVKPNSFFREVRLEDIKENQWLLSRN